MDNVPEISDVIDNYLNGKYAEFQKAISKIKYCTSYDPFFSDKIDIITR